jgi:GNAT superfamily N-acetyltransferase
VLLWAAALCQGGIPMAHRIAGEIAISTDPTRLDVDAVHGWLKETYWSPGLPREVLERALSNSMCFGAYEGPRQVGFARVVTDRATFAWVCDVFVVESHRRRGIADAMLAAMKRHPELQGLRRWSLATRDAHALYRRHGFEPLADPSRAMEIRRPDVYQTDAGQSQTQGKPQT